MNNLITVDTPTVGLLDPMTASAAARQDAELLAAIGRGSEPAFAELRRRYARAIAALCRTTAVVPGQEDCTQEVYFRIWQKAAVFDPQKGRASAWLLTVARNCARNLWSHRAVPEPLPRLDELPALVDDERFGLGDALERLSPQERRVIELAYIDDLTQTQIASTLGVPLGTVKSWNRRALNRLASVIDSEGSN